MSRIGIRPIKHISSGRVVGCEAFRDGVPFATFIFRAGVAQLQWVAGVPGLAEAERLANEMALATHKARP